MDLLLQVFLLALGFFLLSKGADFFVDGAGGIADKFRVPQLVIGLTIVAFGTSAPEAAISINAGLQGSAGISIGNVLGSNILNILLILGLTALIIPLKIQSSTLKKEIPFTLIISIILAVMGLVFGQLNWIAGLILWGLFILFFVYLIRLSKENAAEFEKDDDKPNNENVLKLILMTLGGMAAIIVGSNFAVNSATALAEAIGISDRIIGLTVVAFGTSLPELITSVTAARKGSADIAIGNIIGSNIFNILFVLGTTSLITTIPYGQEFLVDSIIAVVAVALLLICVLPKRKLTRVGGGILLASYVGYFVYLLLGTA